MNFLKKTLKVSAIGALTATLAFSVMDAKAEDAGTNITATVTNAITFAETQALSFGEFVAINHASDVSTITMANDGSGATYGNTGSARITEIVEGNMGIFDVSDAAINASLTLTLPTTVTLDCTLCGASNPDFSVGTFTSDPAVGSLTTNGSGAATINIGATLTTVAGASNYEDGDDTGAYTVSVNY